MTPWAGGGEELSRIRKLTFITTCITTCLLLVGQTSLAAAKLPFHTFLKEYQKKSGAILQAQQNLSRSEFSRDSNSDQWQSRLTATPEINFLGRNFDDSSFDNISNRNQSIAGSYSQLFPTGTKLEVTGQKFIEVANPLFSSYDRSYSANITQDLFRNAFGETQRAQTHKAKTDYKIAELEFLNSVATSCEEAFQLYTEAYIQQEITDLLRSQLMDAQKALTISRRLYKNKLINKIDKLTSESDFINTKQDADQATLKLINTKRQILAFLESKPSLDFLLNNPGQLLNSNITPRAQKTMNEILALHRLKSQEIDIQRSQSDRRTDVQLNLTVGERYGRTRITNTSFAEFKEDYLLASVNIGFDIIKKTEDADLRNAITQKNNLEKVKRVTETTQKMRLDNLYANHELLQQQVQSSEIQVKLLQEKMKIAFNQMRRAKLDFQNYLLHRNAFLNQKINSLNLQKELWFNQVAIQKEFAQRPMNACGGQS